MTAPSAISDTAIDRIAPTQRPLDRVVMRQSWRHLLFLHWTVPVQMLRPLIPPELEIDTFEGQAYVGLVPFTMTGVRPIWAPRFRPLSDFHEINVRTYVHFEGANPGVWFFSLDAANSVAVRLARALWKLPYYFAQMHLYQVTEGPDGLEETPFAVDGTEEIKTIDYHSERLWPEPVPAVCSVRYSPTGAVTPAATGTLEHFLAERYLLYSTDGRHIYRGQVNHTPYPLQTAVVQTLEENLLAAAGIERGESETLAHYARGVDVEIFPLRPVTMRANGAG